MSFNKYNLSHADLMDLVETAVEDVMLRYNESILKSFTINTVMSIIGKYEELPEDYKMMVVETVKGKISLGTSV